MVNGLLGVAWSLGLAAWLSRWTRTLLNSLLTRHRPRTLAALEVEALQLGAQPPRVRDLRLSSVRLPVEGRCLQLDVALQLRSESLEAILRAEPKGPGSTAALYGRRLDAEAHLRVLCRYNARRRWWSWRVFDRLCFSLLQDPTYVAEVKALTPSGPVGPDLAALPVLEVWLSSKLRELLSGVMAWPKRLSWTLVHAQEEAEAEAAEGLAR